MVRRRRYTEPLRRVTRTVYRKGRGRVRRPRKNDFKKYGMKAAKGVGLGLAVAIPLTIAGQRLGQPLLAEAGQRLGSIASTYVGGTIGNASYQAADAIFDRFVSVPSLGGRISGTGQVYL